MSQLYDLYSTFFLTCSIFLKTKKPLSYLKDFLNEYGSYLLSRPACAGCSPSAMRGLSASADRYGKRIYFDI
jgi:hypothetical protein